LEIEGNHKMSHMACPPEGVRPDLVSLCAKDLVAAYLPLAATYTTAARVRGFSWVIIVGIKNLFRHRYTANNLAQRRFSQLDSCKRQLAFGTADPGKRNVRDELKKLWALPTVVMGLRQVGLCGLNW